MPQFCTVFVDLFEVIADLFAVPKDFLFAGAVVDVPSKLGSIFFQLLVIPTHLSAVLFNFIAGIANIFEIPSNLGLVVMAAVVVTNITPVFMLLISSVMPIFSIMVVMPFAVVPIPPVMILFVLGIVSRG
jgi:hypothetical protein